MGEEYPSTLFDGELVIRDIALLVRGECNKHIAQKLT